MINLGRFTLGYAIFNQLSPGDLIKPDGPKPAGLQKPGPKRFGIMVRHDIGPILKVFRWQRKSVNPARRSVEPKDCRVQHASSAQGQVQGTGRKTIASPDFYKSFRPAQGRNQFDPLADRTAGVVFDDQFARRGVQKTAAKKADHHRQNRDATTNQMGQNARSSESHKNNCLRFCHLFHPVSTEPVVGPRFSAPHEPYGATLGLFSNQNMNALRETVANLATMFLKPDKCLASS